MQLQFKLNKNIEDVFLYLTDMQKFVSVHPLIFKMESLDRDKYLVYEKIKIGFIPITFTYPVTIQRDGYKRPIVFKAVVFKLTKITMRFELAGSHLQTIITETVTFETPLPIKWLLKLIFKKQHKKLFETLERSI